jgi:hypothetical protein
MAEYHGRQLESGALQDVLLRLDNDVDAIIAIPFQKLNMTVWIQAPMQGLYHVAVTCEGDETHEKHIVEELPLLSAEDVAAGLSGLQMREAAAAAASSLFGSLN